MSPFWPTATTRLKLFPLANGQSVWGLHRADTNLVYEEIFVEDCYRRHGIVIRDGDCVFDVGANTGLFLMFLAMNSHRVTVFAFEPISSIFEALSRNAEPLVQLKTRLFNLGLSDRPGEADFAFYPRMSNASTMYPDHSPEEAARARDYIVARFRTLPQPLAWLLCAAPRRLQLRWAERVRRYYMRAEQVKCRLTTLHEVFAEHSLSRVDLLKIDAEHSEEAILKGLADSDWDKIRQIIVEVHGGCSATERLVSELDQRGFCTGVDPNHAFPTLFLVFGVRRS